MTNYLHVTADDICDLSDVDLREITARLCISTLKQHNHSASAVLHGGDQRSMDGGIDVSVNLASTASVSGFVPTPTTGFQVKAEDFGAAKIAEEMAPQGTLRESIRELASSNGSYIIVSSKGSVAEAPLKKRIAAMRKCLPAKLQSSLHVDFYDRTRIADWVNEHPSLVPWVRAKAGRPTTGWQSHGTWAYDENNLDSEYVIDDKVRVFTPNDNVGTPVIDAINQLRETLAQSKRSVRIVGLSGVGKTRLLQALFDERIETSTDPLDVNKVVYCDLSDNPDPQPIALLDELIARNERCLLIVDNCGGDLHRRLSELVRKPQSCITLATVEYDIREDQSEGTDCYRLDTSSKELISKILQAKYPELSSQTVNIITEFSDGNARVAFALASTATIGGDLAQLSDTGLFNRIFQQGHDSQNDLLETAKVCALFYSFDIEDLDDDNSEMAVLGKISAKSTPELYKDVKALQRRGLVQARGNWRAILPHAIANRLAKEALDSYPIKKLASNIMESGQSRLFVSFAHRLSFLHDDTNAKAIVSNWLEDGGVLSDIGALSGELNKVLNYAAPVNPKSVLGKIFAFSEVSSDADGICNFIIRESDLIRSLAYEETDFVAAAGLLVIGALESDNSSNNTARDALKSLFSIYLSGTHAPPLMRSSFVDALLSSPNSEKRDLGRLLLDEALNAGHFSSSFSFDFGGRIRDWGWQPKTNGEGWEWYDLFLMVAQKYGCQDNEDSRKIRTIVGRNFRGLWTSNGNRENMLELSKKFKAVDGWPEGWRSLRLVRKHDFNEMPDDVKEDFKRIENAVEPNDLESEIRGKVLVADFYGLFDEDIDDEENSFDAKIKLAQENARALGKRLGNDTTLLVKLFPTLISHSAFLIQALGEGVSIAYASREDLLESIREQIEELGWKKSTPNFLSGVLKQANEEFTNTFLDKAIYDGVFGKIFPQIQMSMHIETKEKNRLVEATKAGLANADQFWGLHSGGSTKPLTVDEIDELIFAITFMEDGQPIATDILGMVVFGATSQNNEITDEYRSKLAELCRKFLLGIDWIIATKSRGAMASHYIKNILKHALSEGADFPFAVSILRQIIETNKTEYISSDLENILIPLFEAYPRECLEEVYGHGGRDSIRQAKRIFKHGYNDRKKTALSCAPLGEVVAWCANCSAKYEFLANICDVFEPKSIDKKLEMSELALCLLQNAPSKDKVLSELVNRFKPMSWSGSRAVAIRQRLPILEALHDVVQGLDIATLDGAISYLKKCADDCEIAEQARESSRNETFE